MTRWNNREKQLQSPIIEVDVQKHIKEAEAEMAETVKALVQDYFDGEINKLKIYI